MYTNTIQAVPRKGFVGSADCVQRDRYIVHLVSQSANGRYLPRDFNRAFVKFKKGIIPAVAALGTIVPLLNKIKLILSLL